MLLFIHSVLHAHTPFLSHAPPTSRAMVYFFSSHFLCCCCRCRWLGIFRWWIIFRLDSIVFGQKQPKDALAFRLDTCYIFAFSMVLGFHFATHTHSLSMCFWGRKREREWETLDVCSQSMNTIQWFSFAVTVYGMSTCFAAILHAMIANILKSHSNDLRFSSVFASSVCEKACLFTIISNAFTAWLLFKSLCFFSPFIFWSLLCFCPFLPLFYLKHFFLPFVFFQFFSECSEEKLVEITFNYLSFLLIYTNEWGIALIFPFVLCSRWTKWI